MAKRNYREIQLEYLRRVSFGNHKRPFREYHTAEPVAEMLQRLSRPMENGCHVWIGKIGTHGYAYCSYRKGRRRFHRKAATVAFELKYGAVPDGKEVSHLCSNRRCVNPDHLIAETHRDNLERREWRPQTRRVFECKRCGDHKELIGSEYCCRRCNKERSAAWQQRNPNANREYRLANKDRINAQRRARRARVT